MSTPTWTGVSGTQRLIDLEDGHLWNIYRRLLGAIARGKDAETKIETIRSEMRRRGLIV